MLITIGALRIKDPEKSTRRNHLVQHNKLYHRKVALSSFNLEFFHGVRGLKVHTLQLYRK